MGDSVEISIIVPVYNSAAYLDSCLDSLTHQTFADIEVLLVDDGSTDGSLAIMRNWANRDDRLRILCPTTKGVAAARNFGLDSAHGRYVMFCDSDDRFSTNMCEKLHRTIVETGVDVVACGFEFDVEAGVSQQEVEYRAPESYFNPGRSGTYDLIDEMVLETNVLLMNKIWRRDTIERFSIRFPLTSRAEDNAFWMQYALSSGKIHYLTDRLYRYLIRSGSLMGGDYRKRPKNLFDCLRAAESVIDFAERTGLLAERSAMLRTFWIQMWNNASRQFGEAERKEESLKVVESIERRLGREPMLVSVEGRIYQGAPSESSRLRLLLKFMVFGLLGMRERLLTAKVELARLDKEKR